MGAWLLWTVSAWAGVHALDLREAGVLPPVSEGVAVGPDRLAVGIRGVVAVWDGAGKRILVDDGQRHAFRTGHVDDLAVGADGSVLVLDGLVLRAYTVDGTPTGEVPLPPLAPPGMPLAVRGDVVCVLDAFSNCHAVATTTAEGLVPRDELIAPAHAVVRRGGAVYVDGVAVWAGTEAVSARLVGDWVVVRDRGARVAVRIGTGERVTLPASPAWGPERDVAAGPDGSLAWLVDGPGVRVRE